MAPSGPLSAWLGKSIPNCMKESKQKKKKNVIFLNQCLYQKDDFCDRISVHNDNNKRGLEGINNERFIVAEKDSRYDLAPFF